MKTNNAMAAVVALLILLFLVIVTSCGELPDNSRIKTIKTNYGNISMRAYDFSYGGHKYIYFRKSSGKFESGGVIHDPDCCK